MTCTAPQAIKKAYAEQLPPVLAKKYGRKKHYSRQEIHDGIAQCGLPVDYSCWAMAMFEAPDAFAASHRSAGEVCDYAAMHGEMLRLIPSPGSDAWSLFDWDWVPWDILDWFDWSP